MIELKLVEKIGNEYIQTLKANGYEMPEFIKFRLQRANSYRTYGSCKIYRNNDNVAEISINRSIKHESDLRNTIAHELTHAIKKCPRHNHDKCWQRVAREVTEILRLEEPISRTGHKELDMKIDTTTIKFKMTPIGAANQRYVRYRNTEKVFTMIIPTRGIKRMKDLEDSGIIEILKD